MTGESPNKAITKGLIETQQSKDSKLYDALRKMNDDLNKTYEALFAGPLPAVDGFNLTRLNAASLDGLVEIDNLPDTVAYTDVANIFTKDQEIKKLFPTMSVGYYDGVTPPTSLFRFAAAANESYIIGQNLYFDGAFHQDNALVDACAIQFVTGEIRLRWWDHLIPALYRTFSFVGRELFGFNIAQTVNYSIIKLDVNDVIHLAEGALATGKGHVAIPAKTAVNLPPAGAANNGIIVLDTTNNRICFYEGGLRYYAAGTAF